MKTAILFLILICAVSYQGFAQQEQTPLTSISKSQLLVPKQWTPLATDSQNDGADHSLLDGKSLSYGYDAATDSIWFKIDVFDSIQTTTFGLNIVLNVENAGPQTAWWGQQNSNFLFNRLISVWVQQSAQGYIGIMGIADVNGIVTQNYTNLFQNNMQVFLDKTTYYLVVKRTDIYNGPNFKASVIAAVGSNTVWNDDLPGSGTGTMTILPTSVQDRDQGILPSDVTVYPNPSSGEVHVSCADHGAQTAPYEISIFTLCGEEVYTLRKQTGTGMEQELDLSHLTEGAYILRFTCNARSTSQRIVVCHP